MEGFEQWMSLAVCALPWVPAKLTHVHVFCLLLDKKKLRIFWCYSLKPHSTKLKVEHKVAAFLFASLLACAVHPLVLPCIAALLLQLLAGNNMEKGTCPKVQVAKFGFRGQLVLL